MSVADVPNGLGRKSCSPSREHPKIGRHRWNGARLPLHGREPVQQKGLRIHIEPRGVAGSLCALGDFHARDATEDSAHFLALGTPRAEHQRLR